MTRPDNNAECVVCKRLAAAPRQEGLAAARPPTARTLAQACRPAPSLLLSLSVELLESILLQLPCKAALFDVSQLTMLMPEKMHDHPAQ